MSFPERSQVERNKIIRRFYIHFCQTFIESLKMLSISSNKMKERYRIINPELLEQLYQDGKSCIIYGAHMGNWEWMSSIPLLTRYPLLSFYQKQSNAYFNDLMLLLRGRFGNNCVEYREGLKSMASNNRDKKLSLYYIIGDQSPMDSSALEWINFLNRSTAFLMGAPKMAEKFNCDIVYPMIRQSKMGYYETELIQFPRDLSAEEMVRHYALLLERNIKEQPSLWLWSHRRWKLKQNK